VDIPDGTTLEALKAMKYEQLDALIADVVAITAVTLEGAVMDNGLVDHPMNHASESEDQFQH